MSIVLVVIGVTLVAVGVLFAWVNKAGATAGGSGLKSISVEGPAWLVLIVVGLASTFLGVMRWEDGQLAKQADRSEVTAPPATIDPFYDDVFYDEFPNGFTFGDNNDLDRLWRACERGVWSDCDDLYFQSDIGSDYEWFGATCGQPDLREPSELWCDPQRNIDEGLIEP